MICRSHPIHRLMFLLMIVCFVAGTADSAPPAEAITTHTLSFDTTDKGAKLNLTEWGLDTAWDDLGNVTRGIEYMGRDQVDIIRVSFPINEPLVDGDLPPSKYQHVAHRLELARLIGDKPFTMLPDTDRGVHPWFKDGQRVNPEKWVQLIAATQKRYGKKMESIEAFNEADWGWGQGSAQNLNEILALLKKHPDFQGVKIAGPSTLATSAALGWYEVIKDKVDYATTHTLGGGMDAYLNFFERAKRDGKILENPEVHNLCEVISGAEYGLHRAIWWGGPELARGEFVKAVHGERLAYAEDRPTFTAAGVYRSPDGKIQAFAGSSERQGGNCNYRFIVRDRDVFFNGVGPRRDFTYSTRRSEETLINIQWGEDIQPVVQGKYIIMNVATHKALAVTGASMENGAGIEQADYQAKKSQQWEIWPISTSAGDQSYVTLRALHSGRVVDTTKWSVEEGTMMQQWGEGDAVPQHWVLEYAGENNFRLRSRCSGKYLVPLDSSKEPGAAIVQMSRSEKSDQLWRLIPLTDQPIDFDPPAAPHALVAKDQSHSVALNWEASSEPDVTGYNVYRGESASGPYNLIARSVIGNGFVDHSPALKRENYYIVRAVDRSMNLSARSTEVSVTPNGASGLLAHYAFDGSAQDVSPNANHPELSGSPTFGVGRGGTGAIILDGESNFLRLPANVGDQDELTIAVWVNRQSGEQWQRIFDFGNDQTQYFFLAANASDGNLRVAMKNKGPELTLVGPAIGQNHWTHVAVTIGNNSAKLYVDGKEVVGSDAWSIKPRDIQSVFNYIGKSQFAADPLFKGRLCDLRIYNHVVGSETISKLAESH